MYTSPCVRITRFCCRYSRYTCVLCHGGWPAENYACTHHWPLPDKTADRILCASLVLVPELHYQTACKADRINHHFGAWSIPPGSQWLFWPVTILFCSSFSHYIFRHTHLAGYYSCPVHIGDETVTGLFFSHDWSCERIVTTGMCHAVANLFTLPIHPVQARPGNVCLSLTEMILELPSMKKFFLPQIICRAPRLVKNAVAWLCN